MAELSRSGGGASALPLNAIAQAIPRLTRHDLEALTERLIERLDELDGDCDLEEDDPCGVYDEDGQNTGFGYETPPDRFAELMPKYEVDQSQGPTNFNAAYREWWQRAYGAR